MKEKISIGVCKKLVVAELRATYRLKVCPHIEIVRQIMLMMPNIICKRGKWFAIE